MKSLRDRANDFIPQDFISIGSCCITIQTRSFSIIPIQIRSFLIIPQIYNKNDVIQEIKTH